MHGRKRVGTEGAPRAGEARVVGSRRARMRISRRRVEMVLVSGPQGTVPVLLELDEGAFRHRRRVVGLVGRWRADVALAGHGRRPRRIVVRPPERGPQIREVQRRERFVIHFGEVRRRLEDVASWPVHSSMSDKMQSHFRSLSVSLEVAATRMPSHKPLKVRK